MSHLLDLEKDLHQLLLAKARKNLIHFARLVYPKYEAEDFHFLIADILERVFRGELRRVVLSIHPRSGKTELCSKLGPAFYAGAYPGNKLIAATYGMDLTQEMGKDARKYVLSDEFKELFPEPFMPSDDRGQTSWRLRFKNGIESRYFGTSVGSSITGKGGNVLLIDDPVKGYEAALNADLREKTHGWFKSDARSRLEEVNSSIMIIQTRWHEDDLSGRCLLDPNEEWVYFNLPAFVEEGEEWSYPLTNPDYIEELGMTHVGRKAGEPLYPTKYPMERYLTEQAADPVFFPALYLGNPCTLDGDIFKREKIWVVGADFTPDAVLKLQSWDTSQTDKKRSDFSAKGDYIYDGFNLFKTGLLKRKMLYPELKATALDEYDRFRPDFVLIEQKSNGIDLINDLAQTSLPVIPVPVNQLSLEIRALSVSADVAGGWVRIRNSPWVADFITSLTKFPKATHDDDVAQFVQIIRWLRDKLSNAYFSRAITKDNFCAAFRPPPTWPVIRAIHIPPDGGPYCVVWMTTVQEQRVQSMGRIPWPIGTHIVFCEIYGEDESQRGSNRGEPFSVHSLLERVYEVERVWGITSDLTYANPSLWNPIQSAQGLANALFEEGMFVIPGVQSESIGLPLLSSLLTGNKLVITETCKSIWRTLPFLERSEEHTYVLKKSQETGPVHALMLVAAAAMKGASKPLPKPPFSEQHTRDAIRYKNIFGE